MTHFLIFYCIFTYMVMSNVIVDIRKNDKKLFKYKILIVFHSFLLVLSPIIFPFYLGMTMSNINNSLPITKEDLEDYEQ